MRGSRPGFALRRRASAWLGIASLLGLFLVQPFHAPLRAEPANATATVGATLALSASGSHAADHDAGTCQVCRAVSQVRSGVRTTIPIAVSQEPLRSLHEPAAPLPGAAPVLLEAWPRAPPAAHTA
jgi:hypothetical protein